MQNSNSNPTVWVTSQDGRIRFDASPLLTFFEEDGLGSGSEYYRDRTKEAADDFALFIAQSAGETPMREKTVPDILRIMFIIRDISSSLQCNGK